MFKPDNFKLINDTYGHEAGDLVLRLMAAEVRRHVDSDGFAVRYMGNELAVVIPDCDRRQAGEKARTIQSSLNSLDLTSATGNGEIRLTASFGVAVYPHHSRNANELIEAAHALPLVGRGRGGNLILFPEDG
jgi:diguanylate cyclase (GGDEF)-like protein